MTSTTETIRLPFQEGSGSAAVSAAHGAFEPEWESHLDLIRRSVAQGATPDELRLFLYTAKRAGLDPLARQIYFIKRAGRGTVQVSIDGLRLIADRTGRYAGGEAPEFLGETPEGYPMIARVTIYKMVGGVRCPFSATARWDEYYPGENQGMMWRKMAHTMLAKCAEALALRRAFPADLSGLYVHEEMAQAGGGMQAVQPDLPATSPEPVQPETPAPEVTPEEPRRHGPGVTPETPRPSEPATAPDPFEPGPSPQVPEPPTGPAPIGDPAPAGPEMAVVPKLHLRLEEKEAFGYRPAKWPTARMMGEAATENQFRMLKRKADDRRLTEKDLAKVREAVVEAYGLDEDASKGALSLVIDFLMAADDEQLAFARGLRRAA